MNEKADMIAKLREEYTHWEGFLSGLNEAQLAAPHHPSAWSKKDVIAHLWAWQQLSIARLEAALEHREPQFSMWPAELEPESEDDLEEINAWIYEANRARPWPRVHRDWQEGFLRFLALAEAIPEQDLLDSSKYPWLEGYSLYDVLLGSYEHHYEHHL